MRRLIIALTLMSLGLVITIPCLGMIITDLAPLQPGNPFFPLQRFSELGRARLISNSSGKAIYYLNLVERRTSDLDRSAGTQAELPALIALNEALDLAQAAVSAAPEADQALLLERMIVLAENAYTSLNRLSVLPEEAIDLFNLLEGKVNTIRLINYEPKIVIGQDLRKARNILRLPQVHSGFDPNAVDSIAIMGSIVPHSVQFPAGSPGAEHAFFPLLGMHAQLACEGCHASGQFAGTASECAACHASVKPIPHFSGDCASCHTAVSWRDVHFDHALASATNCRSCHAADKPANHFTGQCSACHGTNAWKPASFNHQAAGATDCQSCHTRPANHSGGQCSACHNTSAWQPASFSHEGQTDCQSCHTRPAGHFGGQCSACHNTSAWLPASFNHDGQTDCQGCHTPPANHWGGQCSNCHNTQDWSGVHVGNHSFPIDHKGANGVCSVCHPANNSNWTCYNCHNQAETEKHHAEKDIFDIGNRCIECHPSGDDD